MTAVSWFFFRPNCIIKQAFASLWAVLNAGRFVA